MKPGGHKLAGTVINISAPFRNLGVSLQAHGAAAKAGVDALTRTCAVEFGPFGIRVNAIAPGGMTDAAGLARFAAATKARGAGATSPVGEPGAKRDGAGAVLCRASDGAADVTGRVFAVDGGAGIDMLKMRLPRE